MKLSPKLTGLIQAVCISAYVFLFATAAQNFIEWAKTNSIEPHPILGAMLFLLAFIVSALISGSIVLAYPIWLFFTERKTDAFKTVLWSAIWLALIVVILLFWATAFFLVK